MTMGIKLVDEPSDCCVLCSMNLAVESIMSETKKLWGPVGFLNIYWGGAVGAGRKLQADHFPPSTAENCTMISFALTSICRSARRAT
jgi:hypothetical protein